MPSYFEWRYVVEVRINEEDWRSINSFDDKDQAVDYAKDQTRPARVRQYCTTVFTKPVVEGSEEAKQMEDAMTVPTIPWYCVSHPDQVATALSTSSPRCPTCHQTMFQGDGSQPIQDL